MYRIAASDAAAPPLAAAVCNTSASPVQGRLLHTLLRSCAILAITSSTSTAAGLDGVAAAAAVGAAVAGRRAGRRGAAPSSVASSMLMESTT
jgi:hypothetical protein